MIGTVILIFGLVFSALSAANVPSPPRFNWTGAAIFCGFLFVLLGAVALR